MHMLVRELLALMPPDGSPWPRPARERWVAAFSAVLELVYEDDGRTVDLRTPDVEALSGRGRHARPTHPE